MEYPIYLNELLTNVDVNILPLGSYDSFIGMGWSEKQRFKLDYYNKVLKCIDEKGRTTIVRRILKQVLIRKILILQIRKLFKEDFQLYLVYVSNTTEDKGPRLEGY